MKQMIVDFVRLLRSAGLTVTTMEAADALKAAEITGFSPVLLRGVLEATLVKSLWERPVFTALFDLYFDLASPAELTGTEPDLLIIKGATADGSGRSAAGAGGSAEQLLETIDSQPIAVLEALAREITASVQLDNAQPEEISGKLRQLQVKFSWFEAVNKIERSYVTQQITENAFQKWQKTFAQLKALLRRELERKAVSRFGRQHIVKLAEYANIRRREFDCLATAEIAAVEQEIAKLAKKLAERPGIRLRRAKSGTLDMRRTFQDVVRTGGWPLHLKYRDKVKSKVDLWLLCDVSNSVERFSRFMLQLVQAAHRRYANIRSFVFVDEAVEVTDWFKTQDVNAFLEARHLRERFNRRVGLSRYDLVFEQIARYESAAITARTKLIILGDGRNNWHPGGAEELAKLADRAQAVYWLNPLPADKWLEGDCLMQEYQRFCNQVFECRNLEQLTDVANRIL
ncbi:VWA domain-containing protein [Sporomusa termitida]|uniref:VWA domain containing CoxE-like protein n=1 Tax=Sporomusa termitida TaxID=2377 RepID=A0A517DS74_9FIRM|nr:VWA domain-containing protein [Sporomusa termitida]QDR80157.1 VWA domain containing CoxE-like protein [Sporomusa termitida]